MQRDLESTLLRSSFALSSVKEISPSVSAYLAIICVMHATFLLDQWMASCKKHWPSSHSVVFSKAFNPIFIVDTVLELHESYSTKLQSDNYPIYRNLLPKLSLPHLGLCQIFVQALALHFNPRLTLTKWSAD